MYIVLGGKWLLAFLVGGKIAAYLSFGDVRSVGNKAAGPSNLHTNGHLAEKCFYTFWHVAS